jgi:hypothetical protein
MAMEHPVAGVAGNELRIPRLRYFYEYCISRTPRGLRLSSSFSTCNYELVPMNVDRMVVHPQIDEADADALPVPDDERSDGWTGFSVEGKPVELHVHGVRNIFAKSLTKGAHIQVEGELRSRECDSKKTDSRQRVWEIRVSSILKLDRAEKAAPEDQGQDDETQKDTTA